MENEAYEDADFTTFEEAVPIEDFLVKLDELLEE